MTNYFVNLLLWRFLALMLVCLLATPGQSLGHEPEAKVTVLAVVNEDTITDNQVSALLVGMHGRMESAALKTFDYRKLLDKLINDRLLIQEATLMELDQDAGLLDTVAAVRAQEATGIFARDAYQPDLSIDSSAINEYFEKYYSRIQVRTVAIATEAEAEALAEAVRNGADMDSIAREVSLDSKRINGGLRKFMYYGDLELEFRNQADNLKLGEVSGPFPYREVFAITRLEQLADPNPDDLPVLYQKITGVLRYRKNQAARVAFFDSLLTINSVSIDTARLDAVRADSGLLFTPEFMLGSEDVIIEAGYGYTLTDDQLRKTISHGAMQTATDPFDSLFARGLRQAHENLVLKTAARSSGFFDHPAVELSCRKFLDSCLIESYLQQNVVPLVELSREEVDSCYDANLDDYLEPTRYQFEQLIFADEELAMKASKRLSEGGDFNFVANQLGGELTNQDENGDWMSLNSIPDQIRSLIEPLKVGACTAPLSTEGGWLILKVRARKEGKPLPRAEVEGKVRNRLFLVKFGQLMDETLDLLKSNSDIWYNETAVQELFGDDDATASQDFK